VYINKTSRHTNTYGRIQLGNFAEKLVIFTRSLQRQLKQTLKGLPVIAQIYFRFLQNIFELRFDLVEKTTARKTSEMFSQLRWKAPSIILHGRAVKTNVSFLENWQSIR
jgi:hypothetical protein